MIFIWAKYSERLPRSKLTDGRSDDSPELPWRYDNVAGFTVCRIRRDSKTSLGRPNTEGRHAFSKAFSWLLRSCRLIVRTLGTWRKAYSSPSICRERWNPSPACFANRKRSGETPRASQQRAEITLTGVVARSEVGGARGAGSVGFSMQHRGIGFTPQLGAWSSLGACLLNFGAWLLLASASPDGALSR